MSMRLAIPAENVPGTAYLVAAPCPGDTLSVALRCAFATADRQFDPFEDVMRRLDAIELRRPA